MMRRLMWFLLGFALVAVPMLASAGYQWREAGRTATFGSAQAVKDAWFAARPAGDGGSSPQTYKDLGWWSGDPRTPSGTDPGTWKAGGSWNYKTMGGIYSIGTEYRYCAPVGEGQASGGCGCQAGLNEVGGVCVKACTAGDPVSTIAHYGWVSTWNADATVWGGKNPSSTCSGANKCRVTGLTPDTQSTCKGIDSLSGTQGPYPVFCWYKGTTDGSVCSASEQTAAQKLQQPDPIPCPSGTALGAVNGKSGCYAVSETTANKTTNPDGSTVTEKTTVNPDGSKTVEKTTCDAAGNCSTTRQTMDKPAESSGEVGVGTPSAGGGNGTGAGGPPGTGSGQKGETEQADFCKDNPKVALCQERLKIDETGTPSSAPGVEAGFKSSLDAVIAQAQYLEGMGWLRDGIPLIWNPAANLPGGACYAWDFGHGSIDPCPTAERIRSWWSFAIVFIAGLYAWHRATTIFKG